MLHNFDTLNLHWTDKMFSGQYLSSMLETLGLVAAIGRGINCQLDNLHTLKRQAFSLPGRDYQSRLRWEDYLIKKKQQALDFSFALNKKDKSTKVHAHRSL